MECVVERENKGKETRSGGGKEGLAENRGPRRKIPERAQL